LRKGCQRVQQSPGGTNEGRIREVETSLIPAGPITLPPANQRTPGWWKSLSSGQRQRQITLEAAEFVLRTIVTAVLGSNTAHQLEIDFGSDNLPGLAELWSAIADTCGAAGWTALIDR
jgi:hypothetical protein